MCQISLDAAVTLGTPTDLSVLTVVGLVLVLGGIIGLIAVNRRLEATKRAVPPPAQNPQPGWSSPPQQFVGSPPVLPIYQRPEVRKALRLRGLATATLVVGILPLLIHYDSDAPTPPGVQRGHLALPDVAGGVHKVPTPPAVEEYYENLIKSGKDLKYATYAHPQHPDGKPLVMVFVGLEGRWDPKVTMDAFFRDLATHGQFEHGITEHPGRRSGETIECASIPVPQRAGSEVHCAWADGTTLGQLFTEQITEPELATLLARMRPDLEPNH
ncbi:hypothetical protein AB0E69_34020 [Kribbella sp. NPDC026611]|uniref:hypothetical protein n=1 Tax=Kribbella sp. NPDC026611 TaxID=3154911 RepID=UPI0033FB324C